MDASLLALSAALGGGNGSSASRDDVQKSKGKGKGKAKKTSSPSPAAAPAAADLMKVLAATVKAVDGHTASISKTDKEMAAMKQTMESIQQVVVQLGKRSLEGGDSGAKKKRKVPEHIVNYYLVATEFFNHFSQLTGVPQKKALGKSGIDAWGKNKDNLVVWFKENGLDLEANKLKIADIRTIISDNSLYDKFKTEFDELCDEIENAQPPEDEEQEQEDNNESSDEEEGEGQNDDDDDDDDDDDSE